MSVIQVDLNAQVYVVPNKFGFICNVIDSWDWWLVERMDRQDFAAAAPPTDHYLRNGNESRSICIQDISYLCLDNGKTVEMCSINLFLQFMAHGSQSITSWCLIAVTIK